MTVHPVAEFNKVHQSKNSAVFSAVFLAETPSDNAQQNYCRTEYKKYFSINKLPDNSLSPPNSVLETLIKYGNEWRKELYAIRGQIARDQKRLSQTDANEYPIAAQHDVEEINRYTEMLNNKINLKIQELVNFQVDCGGHLKPGRNAVIEEERRRLEGMKLKPRKIMSQQEKDHVNSDINKGQHSLINFRKRFGRSDTTGMNNHSVWGVGILNGVRPVPIKVP